MRRAVSIVRRVLGGVGVLSVGLLPVAGYAQSPGVDPALANYSPVSGVSGSLKSAGSDSMNNTMTLWAEGFQRMYPNVRIEIEGKGSSTAPPALIAGTAQFGPMSRPMRSAGEIDEFQARYGYQPYALRTGIDLLAVYVHRDNPIAQTGLTLQQVDAIFSTNRRGGHPTDIRTWGDLGLTGEWANKPITLFGRNSASGTYGYFKENALFNGDYKPQVKEQPGSSSVVQGVATDRFAIGYSGIGYITADVRAVPLSATPTGARVSATAPNAYTGEYPLARFLYVYVNARPGTRLDPLRREFIRYVYSRQGQEDLQKDGYYPITHVIAQEVFGDLAIR